MTTNTMKKILIILFLVIILVGYATYDFISKAPPELYAKALKGELNSSWYSDKSLLHLMKPKKVSLTDDTLDDERLWKDIKIGGFRFPMPYRHPRYRVVPVFPSENNPRVGIAFRDNHENEIIRIELENPNYFTSKRPNSQFYEVPFVDYVLSKYKVNELWQDLFTREVSSKFINFKLAVRDLYLLEHRHSFLPEDVISFGALEGRINLKYIELPAQDKDYKHEKVLVMDSGSIHTFNLITRINNGPAIKFREHILNSFKLEADTSNSKTISYAEFKNLKLEDKKDESGFLMMYSAWSQDMKNKFYVQEMIYYLEMNPELGYVLDQAYRYSLWKYNRLFAHHRSVNVVLESRLKLQRKIELEDKKYLKERLELEKYIPPEELDISNTMREKLRRGREEHTQKKHYRIN